MLHVNFFVTDFRRDIPHKFVLTFLLQLKLKPYLCYIQINIFNILFLVCRLKTILRPADEISQTRKLLTHCGPVTPYATEIWVNIGSGNGLVPDGTRTLPKPMLTNHHWCFVTLTWGQFHMKKIQDVYSWYELENYWFKSQLHLPGANELTHIMVFYVFIQTPQIVAMWNQTLSLECNEKHQRYPDGNVLIIHGRTLSCVKFLQWGDQLSV